jgi:hypothetical protein
MIFHTRKQYEPSETDHTCKVPWIVRPLLDFAKASLPGQGTIPVKGFIDLRPMSTRKMAHARIFSGLADA